MPHSTPDTPILDDPYREPFSRWIKKIVWEWTEGQCWYCGWHTNPFDDFCIDHVVPVAHGGTNDLWNLVPCCRMCNTSKGSMLLDDWRPIARRSYGNTPNEPDFWFENVDESSPRVEWRIKKIQEIEYERRVQRNGMP